MIQLTEDWCCPLLYSVQLCPRRQPKIINYIVKVSFSSIGCYTVACESLYRQDYFLHIHSQGGVRNGWFTHSEIVVHWIIALCHKTDPPKVLFCRDLVLQLLSAFDDLVLYVEPLLVVFSNDWKFVLFLSHTTVQIICNDTNGLVSSHSSK